MTSYLEDFVEKIGALPIDINRGLRLIRELDLQFQNTNSKLIELQDEYSSRLKSAKDKKQEAQKPDMQALLAEIRQLQESCIAFSHSKVDVATQNYDIVEMHIQKLDTELKKFEQEIINNQNAENAGLQDETAVKDFKKISKLGSKLITKSQSKIKAQERNAVASVIDRNDSFVSAAPIDKNEPRYCTCNGVSYGDMIKCDNPFCEKEWFHFSCINISVKPKGKWYCADCKKLNHKYKF